MTLVLGEVVPNARRLGFGRKAGGNKRVNSGNPQALIEGRKVASMGTDKDDVVEGVGEPAEEMTLAEPPPDDLDRQGLSSDSAGPSGLVDDDEPLSGSP